MGKINICSRTKFECNLEHLCGKEIIILSSSYFLHLSRKFLLLPDTQLMTITV